MTRRTKLCASFATLVALAPFVRADVEFTAPKAGAILDGGSTITVQWQESTDKPLISQLATYQLFLCMGSNDVMECPLELTAPGAKSFTVTGNQASGMVGVGVGASTPKNAYFLKMISVATTGGTVTNFSPRFSFQKMTGTFSAGVADALKALTGTDGPARIDSTSNAVPVNPADGEYGVDYTMQTGATRYAPMQAVPPTKITKQKATPLHPTSSVVIAKSKLPIPKQQTTITQVQTFAVQSVENTAAAAPMPSDDMAKFLNRWKD